MQHSWWLPRSLLWAGRRSYSIYLCHIPVMFTMRETAYRLNWNMDNQVLLSAHPINELSLTPSPD